MRTYSGISVIARVYKHLVDVLGQGLEALNRTFGSGVSRTCVDSKVGLECFDAGRKRVSLVRAPRPNVSLRQSARRC